MERQFLDDDSVESRPPRRSYRASFAGSRATSVLLGILLHRFLEQWDFSCEKCSMPAALTRTAQAFFAQQGLPYDEALMLEARRLLADFIGSAAWEEIKGSEILGREVPFFYGNAPMMRGTMDILYRLPNGQTVIGDYKTGTTKQDNTAQGKAYQEAVKRALGVEAVFKIIALRD